MSETGKTSRVRFGVEVLLFNVNRFILPMLENCGPHVDKIYALWSERPWRYNVEFRDKVINPTPISIIENSRWRDKVVVVKGEWTADEDQRNARLDAARSDGMDFLIVQDADEYYRHAEYSRMLRTIAEHPEYDSFMCGMYNFWKSTRYVMLNRYGGKTSLEQRAVFALNCKSAVRFSKHRGVDVSQCRVYPTPLPGVAHHLSYVMSDEEVWTKMSTWGHTNDFNWKRWINEHWMKWYPGKRLVGFQGNDYASAQVVEYNGKLPEVLEDFDNPPMTVHRPGMVEWALNQAKGLAVLLYYKLFSLSLKRFKYAVGLRTGYRDDRLFSETAEACDALCWDEKESLP